MCAYLKTIKTWCAWCTPVSCATLLERYAINTCCEEGREGVCLSVHNSPMILADHLLLLVQ